MAVTCVLWWLAVCGGAVCGVGLAAVCLLAVVARRRAHAHAVSLQLAKLRATQPDLTVVGFFHPYCNAGGGGERVLWAAINALQERHPHVHCIVYTGDIDATEEAIVAQVKQRFGQVVDRKRTSFAFLQTREWVEAKYYPSFTMLRQSLGSLVLGWEALCSVQPDVFLDTMGYAFVLPMFRFLGGSKVGCYVHYPTVSTDMLRRVQTREASFNNAGDVSASTWKTSLKVFYYRAFALCYGLVGRAATVVLVNSSWTSGHIKELWGGVARIHTVFPPCDTTSLAELPLADRNNEIVSVAQANTKEKKGEGGPTDIRVAWLPLHVGHTIYYSRRHEVAQAHTPSTLCTRRPRRPELF
eukprot:m.43472 g.43472  ORF g.43472 m.43472 type:complete len:355 (-) comp11637_c0_seq1:110-1174(-)